MHKTHVAGDALAKLMNMGVSDLIVVCPIRKAVGVEIERRAQVGALVVEIINALWSIVLLCELPIQMATPGNIRSPPRGRCCQPD
jgi:hypothetical protein